MDNDGICPVLSIRDLVVFPHIVVPLFAGREKSINALNAAMEGNKKIVLLTQKSLQNDDPAFNDLYHVGVLGSILQLLRLPDNTVKILIEGLDRVKVTECVSDTDYFSVKYEPLKPISEENAMEIEAYRRTALDMFENYSKLNRRISSDIVAAAKNMESVNDLIDIISAHMVLRIKEKQLLLEETSTVKRFEKLLSFMESEIDVINVEFHIHILQQAYHTFFFYLYPLKYHKQLLNL